MRNYSVGQLIIVHTIIWLMKMYIQQTKVCTEEAFWINDTVHYSYISKLWPRKVLPDHRFCAENQPDQPGWFFCWNPRTHLDLPANEPKRCCILGYINVMPLSTYEKVNTGNQKHETKTGRNPRTSGDLIPSNMHAWAATARIWGILCIQPVLKTSIFCLCRLQC